MKLYGFCSHSLHSFLVYESLEKGSADKILKNDELATDFYWSRRVNVIKDVSNALFYMHHDCAPAIFHRDVSNKNVVLDLEYIAYVSDFRTTKFLNLDSSNHLFHSWIINFVSDSIAHTVVFHDSAFDVSQDVKERFSKVDRVRIALLRFSINNLMQGTKSAFNTSLK